MGHAQRGGRSRWELSGASPSGVAGPSVALGTGSCNANSPVSNDRAKAAAVKSGAKCPDQRRSFSPDGWHNRCGLRPPQASQFVQDAVKALAVDELHDVAGQPILLADAEDWNDISVVQARGPRSRRKRAS